MSHAEWTRHYLSVSLWEGGGLGPWSCLRSAFWPTFGSSPDSLESLSAGGLPGPTHPTCTLKINNIDYERSEPAEVRTVSYDGNVRWGDMWEGCNQVWVGRGKSTAF